MKEKVYKYHFVYKTTNDINSKIYVGHRSTNNIKEVYLGSGVKLKKAIKEIGVQHFKREVLEYCEFKDLPEKEIRWILKLQSYKEDIGYNSHIKGTGQSVGFKHSTETICKMKEYSKLRDISGENNPMFGMTGKLNPNFGKGMKKENHPLWGKHHSDETKKKQSLSKIGMYDGDKNPMFGKKHSDKIREKISEAAIKRYKENGNPTKGVPKTKEHSEKLKDSWKIRESIKCPYCEKESVNAANMKRYHFNNCKYKNTIL